MNRPKIVFSAATALLFSLATIHAGSVWRVDNVPGHAADFTSLSTAMASPQVADGDTLVIQGDFTANPLSLTRKLHLVGYGYFHSQNGYQFPGGTALEGRLGSVTITSGATSRADGSSITGCVTAGITILDAADILIRRNKITYLLLDGAGGKAARGVTIAQNYFLGQTANYSTTVVLSGSYSIGDVFIAGNFIPSSGNPWNPGSCFYASSDDSVILSNNVLYGTTIEGYGACQNNILLGGLGASSWVTVRNNAATGTFLPSGSGNLNGVPLSSLFEAGSSPDGQWKLKPGSPALGAGTDGYDMGMFSGPMPYVLSGLPPAPVITGLQVPAVVQDGQDVTVTIRAETKP
jgi:hypothetical protein